MHFVHIFSTPRATQSSVHKNKLTLQSLASQEGAIRAHAFGSLGIAIKQYFLGCSVPMCYNACTAKFKLTVTAFAEKMRTVLAQSALCVKEHHACFGLEGGC